MTAALAALAAGAALLVVMTVAVLSGLRLWAVGRRASGVLGASSSALLGVVAFFMPVELAFFASIDNGQSILRLLGEILDEPWFLIAWSGLMVLTLLPAGLQAAALWFAVPRGALMPEHSPDLRLPEPDPDPRSAPE